MLIIKSAQWDSRENSSINSSTVGVHRLMGNIIEIKNHANTALKMLERGLESDRYFGLENINRDPELVGLLVNVVGNDWERTVSGSIL